MLQGRPETSTSIHNFFGVRLGVREIALSAYPTFEICWKYRDLRDGCGEHRACYSNPCFGFEVVRRKGSCFLFAHGERASSETCVCRRLGEPISDRDHRPLINVGGIWIQPDDLTNSTCVRGNALNVPE